MHLHSIGAVALFSITVHMWDITARATRRSHILYDLRERAAVRYARLAYCAAAGGSDEEPAAEAEAAEAAAAAATEAAEATSLACTVGRNFLL